MKRARTALAGLAGIALLAAGADGRTQRLQRQVVDCRLALAQERGATERCARDCPCGINNAMLTSNCTSPFGWNCCRADGARVTSPEQLEVLLKACADERSANPVRPQPGPAPAPGSGSHSTRSI